MAGGYYGYSGWGKIGSTTVMLTQGASLDRPRNLVVPPPNSNRYGPVNYAEGVRFPVVQLPMIVHGAWFRANNLNAWFVTRSGSTYDLSTVTGGVHFAESVIGAHQVVNAKGGGFSITCRFGQNPLVLQANFHGTTLGTAASPPSPITASPMTFASVSLGGSFANVGIIGFAINYSTGLTPNEELNATNTPVEHNADHPTGSVTIMQYAKPDILPPGYIDADTYEELSADNNNQAYISFYNPDAQVTVTFSFTRLVLQNPNERRFQAGRVVRQFNYSMMADVGAPPMTISET